MSELNLLRVCHLLVTAPLTFLPLLAANVRAKPATLLPLNLGLQALVIAYAIGFVILSSLGSASPLR